MPGTQRQDKVIDCLAAVAWEPGKPLSIETVQVATPKKGEVRIKTERTGICYTDVAVLSGSYDGAQFPCILGHESAAIVESTGPDVTTVKRGDLVLTLWNTQCGDCKDCLDPKKRYCDDNYRNRAVVSRITCNGKKIYKIGPVAAFSEYAVVLESCLLKLDPKAPIEKISPYSCSVPTGYAAARSIAKVRQWSNVVIWGLGVVGLSVALACRQKDARRIIGIDNNPSKFDIGKVFGCTDFINPDEVTRPISEMVAEMTDGGADYVFLCFGTKKKMEMAIDLCHPGFGQCILIGLLERVDQIETYFLNLVGGKTWTGTWCGAHRNRKEVKELVDEYLAGKLIETDYLTTHTITLDKVNEGMQMKNSGASIRTVLVF